MAIEVVDPQMEIEAVVRRDGYSQRRRGLDPNGNGHYRCYLGPKGKKDEVLLPWDEWLFRAGGARYLDGCLFETFGMNRDYRIDGDILLLVL